MVTVFFEISDIERGLVKMDFSFFTSPAFRYIDSSKPCWYICIGPENGSWGNQVHPDSLPVLSPEWGEFSAYIEYLSDRIDTVSCIRAAAGCLAAGLHRHISIKADS